MVAVQSIIFNKYPVEQTLRTLRDMNVTEIELWEGHLPRKLPIYYDLVKKVAKENGIEVIGLVWDGKGFNPYSVKSEDRSSTLDFIKNNIEVCHGIGMKFVTVAEGRPKPPLNDKAGESEAWENLVEAFQLASDIAGEYEITIVNEYHPGMLASTTEKAPKLVDDVDSKWFKACVDFCHADVITGGKPMEFVRALGKRISHVHLGDGDGTPHMHLPLGFGRVDVKACIDEIKSTGYKGHWSLCIYGCPFPEYAVSKSMEWLQKNDFRL